MPKITPPLWGVTHSLPSFTWDASTTSWVTRDIPQQKEKRDPFVTSQEAARKAEDCIHDVVERSTLPLPNFQIGETLLFTWTDDTVWHGPIVVIRLTGRMYTLYEGIDNTDPFTRLSQAWWLDCCYSEEKIDYIVEMGDCQPRVRTSHVVTRSVQDAILSY